MKNYSPLPLPLVLFLSGTNLEFFLALLVFMFFKRNIYVFILLFLELFGFSRVSWLLVMVVWDFPLSSMVLPLPLLPYSPGAVFSCISRQGAHYPTEVETVPHEAAQDCAHFLQHTALFPPDLFLRPGQRDVPSWDPRPSSLGHASGS